jgi:hypothetical protein
MKALDNHDWEANSVELNAHDLELAKAEVDSMRFQAAREAARGEAFFGYGGRAGRAQGEFCWLERPCCRVNACEPLIWGVGARGSTRVREAARVRDAGLRGGASVSRPVIGVLSMRDRSLVAGACA